MYHRGPLFPPPVNPVEFSGGTRNVLVQMPGDDPQEAFMDDIIASGSAATASYPRGEDEAEDEFIGEEFAGEEFGGEEEEYGDKDEEEEQPVAAAKGKNKKKKKAAADKAEPRLKWTSKEDECLAEAWRW